MKEVGLVLEGGGMKGIYTAGVLDLLMEERIHFPYVIGVSAGACQALSYVSQQIGRNKRAILDFVGLPRYISKRNLILHGSIMDMDFVFDDIPNKYEIFDYESFFESDMRCVFVIADCITGKAVYIDAKARKDRRYLSDVVRASSSLPLLTKPVCIDGRLYIDGGMADSIPLRKSMEDGNKKNLVVLTKPAGYRKDRTKIAFLYRSRYKEYPALVKTLIERDTMYNESMEFVEELERKGEIVVIRPTVDLHVGRMEKNRRKLERMYELGYRDAKEKKERLIRYFSDSE
ncbi:MAG: patatin family protein [Peptostreptococcaceae bacterium]|nr:patatin family protein [Peptostreptococcaceae bacterium]